MSKQDIFGNKNMVVDFADCSILLVVYFVWWYRFGRKMNYNGGRDGFLELMDKQCRFNKQCFAAQRNQILKASEVPRNYRFARYKMNMLQECLQTERDIELICCRLAGLHLGSEDNSI